MKTIHIVLIVLICTLGMFGQSLRRPVYRGTYLIFTESQRVDRTTGKPLGSFGTTTVFAVSKRVSFSVTVTEPFGLGSYPRVTLTTGWRIF